MPQASDADNAYSHHVGLSMHSSWCGVARIVVSTSVHNRARDIPNASALQNSWTPCAVEAERVCDNVTLSSIGTLWSYYITVREFFKPQQTLRRALA